MAEIGGITELQILQQEIVFAKKELENVQAGEDTSVSCARVALNIQDMAAKDGFLDGGGGQNRFHTSGPSAEGGCCVML
eukprot:CAMPEP_0194243206 /NCGR_PEP_ID=MMETSP0158-20130606/8488_1 /TAXON_ID=33649 /ORGANISM="Thalassionema nitzschioides, Strain L26-B" /LENGTH=78 /DNA_ID=CAMNT_0038978437 /DNA_START=18 /DNA_END=254 /DNA_ORIENTATION=-